MAKHKPAWLSILPGGLDPTSFSLDELRNAKKAHALLTERIPGPEGIAYHLRCFRFLVFFGIACVAENKYPPLTRCWKELEKLFMSDPELDDGYFVESWILMDFPFGPERQTALDYFQELFHGTDIAAQLQPFIDEARRSRLGLHQDVSRTKKAAKFRELISGRVISAFPSIDAYGKGEILLTRTMAYKNEVFMFGNPKGFPREAKDTIEQMVLDKLFYLDDAADAADVDEDTMEAAQYEKFMKLAGPYWMSCVTKNDDTPILDPDHYRTYLDPQ